MATAPQGKPTAEERMQLPVIRTYLEMTTSPAPREVDAAGKPGVVLHRMQPCSPALYRALYAGVGGPWHWYERLAWSDETLAAHLGRAGVEVHVLEVDGEPAGYFELDRHPEKGTEIAYFGLMPRFIGQGLGGWLLRKAIARAWEGESRRIWLHTCTLDHPTALPNYLRHGFVATGTEEVPTPPK